MNQSPGLGVVTINRAFDIQSWNQWLASATGVSEADARGRSLLSMVARDRVDVVRGLLDEVCSTGTTRVLSPAFHRYLIACPPLETSRHFTEMQQLVTIAPLLSDRGQESAGAAGPTGSIAGAMITIEDVTARLDRERTLTAEIEAGSSEALASAGAAAALEGVGAADWRLRGAAVRALQQRASREEIAHLLEALQRGYHDFNVVSSALQVLVTAHRDVTSPLIDLLSDPNPDLRMHAALALGKVGDHAAVPALVGRLHDEDPNVAFHAIEALGQLGAGDSVEALAEIARSGDFFLSFPAIDALAKTDDPRVAPALTTLLDNALLRPAVIDTLAAVGDEDSVAPLVGVLNLGSEETGGAEERGAAAGQSEAAREVGAVAAALERIRARYEDSFAAGAHIVDLARTAMTPHAIDRLAAAVERRDTPLAPLVTVLGWSGASRLPVLLGVLGDPGVETTLFEAIALIGHDAAGPLIDTLSRGDRAARLSAASLLGELGDRRAVAPLAEALAGADAELSAAAAAALSRLGDASALDPLLTLFAHPQAMARQAAVAAVNAIGADATDARIRPRFDDDDPHVRVCAVRVAGYFGFEACVPLIIRALDDPDEEVRRAAIEQLPVVEDARAVPRLLEALRSETPRNRAAAAHAVRDVDAPAAAAPLAAALEDADPWVRYFAAGSAGRRRDFKAAETLTRMGRSDEAPHVRIAAIQALSAIDPGMAGALAAALVRDPDVEVAGAALAALAISSSPDAEDLLEAAVQSTDPSSVVRRSSAVQALGSRPSARAAQILAWAARLADPPELSRFAVEALGRIAASKEEGARDARTAALNVLVELSAAGDGGSAGREGVRDSVIATLAGLPSHAVDGLAASLGSPRATTRMTVVEALARMRSPRASDALAAALADSDAGVRRAAVAAFGRLGTPAAGPFVDALRTTDPDPGVRRLAAAICRRHGWTSSGPGTPR